MTEKIFLITGGTSGIGLATAQKILQKDLGRVVLIGRDSERGDRALNYLHDSRSFFVQSDVKNSSNCDKIFRDVIEKFGRIDCLINSAGIYHECEIQSVDEDIFDDVFDTNVKGTFFMCRAVVDELRRTRGNIVNISSDAGVRGNYFCSLYSASKGAVVAFTRSLALELARDGVRVNCVCPGDVDTPMTEKQFLRSGMHRQIFYDELASVYPLKRIATADEVANAIVFLASNEASFITGSILAVDGGLTA